MQVCRFAGDKNSEDSPKDGNLRLLKELARDFLINESKELQKYLDGIGRETSDHNDPDRDLSPSMAEFLGRLAKVGVRSNIEEHKLFFNNNTYIAIGDEPNRRID